jgi:hypothetical protein
MSEIPFEFMFCAKSFNIWESDWPKWIPMEKRMMDVRENSSRIVDIVMGQQFVGI